MRIGMYVWMCAFVYVCIYVCIHVLHVWMHVCLCACMHLGFDVCTYMRMYACTYVCMQALSSSIWKRATFAKSSALPLKDVKVSTNSEGVLHLDVPQNAMIAESEEDSVLATP